VVLVLDRLARASRVEDRVLERPASVRGRLELVEVLVAAAAEDVAEAHARRVDVEEERRRVARVPERVDDVRRSACKRLRPARDPRDFRAEPEGDLTLADVERGD